VKTAAGRSGRSRGGRRGRHRPSLARRLVSVVLAAGVVVIALALAGVGYELALPGVGDAQARVAAIVRAHKGTLGGLPVPSKLGKAVVAVEDEHFYSNVFLNVFDGAARAALASLHTSGDPGGSTIAQQLAKQLYANSSSSSGLGATLEQVGLGVKLALSYSKPKILAMYLNAIYYGNGYWGDVSAARGYFGVDPARLTWAEAAMLAGLAQAPSAYDPEEHLALAKLRQRHVLGQLVVNHWLTEGQADAAYAAPLPLRNQ
jgi:membrane peptidoglycan carboxypeptidase